MQTKLIQHKDEMKRMRGEVVDTLVLNHTVTFGEHEPGADEPKPKKPRVWRQRAGTTSWWHSLKWVAERDGWCPCVRASSTRLTAACVNPLDCPFVGTLALAVGNRHLAVWHDTRDNLQDGLCKLNVDVSGRSLAADSLTGRHRMLDESECSRRSNEFLTCVEEVSGRSLSGKPLAH